MGLNRVFARLSTGRVHVLILEIPGYSLLRMHAEAAITARGWVLAEAPADADVLLVCGEATGTFDEIADGLWNQIPTPRHRTVIVALDAMAATLDSIPTVLTDQQRQLADARQRPQRIEQDIGTHSDEDTDPGHHSTQEPGHAAMHHGHDNGQDHAEMRHNGHGAPATDADTGADMDRGDMEMPGLDMGEMDMSHMDMSGPAGIPLASGDESDRDGLEMDVTHLTLGPILPHWPAGLVVHCTLHGDIIGEALVELLPGREAAEAPSGPLAGAMVRAAELCDAAGNLLSVAGWEPVAAKVLRVRDELLTETASGRIAARLHRTLRQVARSRTLRWSLAGIPKAAGIDARARLHDWLSTAAALLAGEPLPADESDWPATLDDVRGALIGQELSTARLVIACIESSRIRTLMGVSHG
ncbi:hypothetical protein [Arthrobacter cryoconiti]|uniref:Uncharacterized protein n=1 Tax=Arthrobacter cryoconiti TaxID=748907 RepID=A0ABV8R408_9MICC|nr:hypothetical protein [Arthrobacter cryoconiti]MCC9069390.1 hypothetical protein [Arthrobacter cryoconiti]